MLVLLMNLYVELQHSSIITHVTFEGLLCSVMNGKVVIKFVPEVESFSTLGAYMVFLIEMNTFHVGINFTSGYCPEATYLTFVRLLSYVL